MKYTFRFLQGDLPHCYFRFLSSRRSSYGFAAALANRPAVSHGGRSDAAFICDCGAVPRRGTRNARNHAFTFLSHSYFLSGLNDPGKLARILLFEPIHWVVGAVSLNFVRGQMAVVGNVGWYNYDVPCDFLHWLLDFP